MGMINSAMRGGRVLVFRKKPVLAIRAANASQAEPAIRTTVFFPVSQ